MNGFDTVRFYLIPGHIRYDLPAFRTVHSVVLWRDEDRVKSTSFEQISYAPKTLIPVDANGAAVKGGTYALHDGKIYLPMVPDDSFFAIVNYYG